jgi:hypothetical protein
MDQDRVPVVFDSGVVGGVAIFAQDAWPALSGIGDE